MSYLSISFTHKNTDIKMREKLAFPDETIVKTFLQTLRKNSLITEVVLLSTCNRVEIMTTVNSIKEGQEFILKELANYSKIDFETLYERADIYDNSGAIHHLFTVAAALDSLVIGETQIVGQLKDAYRLALTNEYCGQKITRAMNYAFKCAANVRNATSLGTGSVSVASTAVAKAKDIFKDEAKDIKALVIGAGEMSRLTIKHLLAYDFKVVLISRNIKKAEMLADTFEQEIEVEPYEKIDELLHKLPVMVTATSAPYPIITRKMIKDSNIKRYWFDIAVPRDIEEMDVKDLEIFAVDDLQDIVDANMSLRAKQAKEAYIIVKNSSEEFFKWLKSLEIEPVIKHMHLKGSEIIERKLENAIQKKFIKEDDKKNIQKLCETVLNEFLHQPTCELKSVSKNSGCDMILGTVQSIFGLNSESDTIHNCEHVINRKN